jgi:hypothetical protein
VTVLKAVNHLQTSATAVTPDHTPRPNYGGPYEFTVRVNGQNIGGIAVPTFTGPISGVGSWYNNGRLVYNPGDDEWNAGTGAATGARPRAPT